MQRQVSPPWLSPRHVQRVMHRNETSFSLVLREKRLNHARQLLTETRLSVETIAAACGYSELSAFYRAFKRRYGQTPGELRRRAAGEGGL